MSSPTFTDCVASLANTGTQGQLEIVAEQSLRAQGEGPQLIPKEARGALINTFASFMGFFNPFVGQFPTDSVIEAHPPCAERNRAVSSSAVLNNRVATNFRGTQFNKMPRSHRVVYGTFREAET